MHGGKPLGWARAGAHSHVPRGRKTATSYAYRRKAQTDMQNISKNMQKNSSKNILRTMHWLGAKVPLPTHPDRTFRWRAARRAVAGAGSTRADGSFRPESYVLLGTIRTTTGTADGMVNRVAYYSRLEENPSWTQFHGGWEDLGAVMRVCFSLLTEEYATWHTLNRMLDEGGRVYYQGFKQERDGTHTIFMVEPCDVPLDVPTVTSPSNKMPRTEGPKRPLSPMQDAGTGPQT